MDAFLWWTGVAITALTICAALFVLAIYIAHKLGWLDRCLDEETYGE